MTFTKSIDSKNIICENTVVIKKDPPARIGYAVERGIDLKEIE